MDGDIIVFQIVPPPEAEYEFPTAREYFRELFYRVGNYSLLFPFVHALPRVINNPEPRRPKHVRSALQHYSILAAPASGGKDKIERKRLLSIIIKFKYC